MGVFEDFDADALDSFSDVVLLGGALEDGTLVDFNFEDRGWLRLWLQFWQQRGVRGVDVLLAELLFLLSLLLWEVV